MQPITVQIPTDPRLYIRSREVRVATLTPCEWAGGYPRELIRFVPYVGSYHRRSHSEPEWRAGTRQPLSQIQRAWVAWDWFRGQRPDVAPPNDPDHEGGIWIPPDAPGEWDRRSGPIHPADHSVGSDWTDPWYKDQRHLQKRERPL